MGNKFLPIMYTIYQHPCRRQEFNTKLTMTYGDFTVAVELHSGCATSRRECFEGVEREAAFLFTPPLTVSLEGLRFKDAT